MTKVSMTRRDFLNVMAGVAALAAFKTQMGNASAASDAAYTQAIQSGQARAHDPWNAKNDRVGLSHHLAPHFAESA